MTEVFLKRIDINNVRNLTPFSIFLGEKRNHLILTGRNGSGKTTLLLQLKQFLEQVYHGHYANYSSHETMLRQHKSILNLPTTSNEEHHRLKQNIFNSEGFINLFGGTRLSFSNEFELLELARSGNFLLAYFSASRSSSFLQPQGVTKLDIAPKPSIDDKQGNIFLQYIVNLKADRSFARDDGDEVVVKKIDEWFDNLIVTLRNLFSEKNLELKFNRDNYNFEITEPNKEPYDFNSLSSGFSAIFQIITELIIRMETKKTRAYDLQGIVLIDEIEMHLHLDLQKKILPFLTSFFPRVQFLITTHSPFILSSLDNTIVYDLEHKSVMHDLTSYSYSALIESYFDSDKYSNELKARVSEYEKLYQILDPSPIQRNKIRELEHYLFNAPQIGSEELVLKLNQIKTELNTANNKP